MSKSRPITVSYGDGIGPEIMEATLQIMEHAGAMIQPEIIQIGETIYKKGVPTGMEDKNWESIYRTKVFLKSPITTPQGGGFQSLNVTIRKKLGLYANIRPCISYFPFVHTKHPNMNVVIIRENEEDVYTGVEYRQTNEMFQCLKFISQSGSQRIIQYAFEYAIRNDRKKVTCFTKDNIMKRTDGLFRKIFEEVGTKYPECETEHWIVDIGAAKLATSPENFDVLVLPNLYGDILSDVAAQITGSVGLAGSANMGDHYAMFEAIHGSAPRRAKQNVANPSGLLQAAILLLIHIDQKDCAKKIQNAWLKTLEDGLHTYDIYQEGVSKKKLGTKEFTEAIIKRLGENPKKLQSSISEKSSTKKSRKLSQIKKEQKTLVGVDVFIDDAHLCVPDFVQKIEKMKLPLSLKSIDSRGLRIWPSSDSSNALLSDHWCCRFTTKTPFQRITPSSIVELLRGMEKHDIDFIKTEGLYLFDGKIGFSK